MTESSSSSHDRLLLAAASLIAQSGLEGLDVKSVAQSAGTSTSQFARHFGSKDELVVAVFTQGWRVIESHISLKLMAEPLGTVESLVDVVLNGALDALAEHHEAVSASLIIAHASLGSNSKARIRDTSAHSRFFQLVDGLRKQFAQRLSRIEAMEGLELLYGAALHRLVLATPMCRSTATPFDRSVFLASMQKMAIGLLTNSLSKDDKSDVGSGGKK